jgi:CO dehydrogenase/acetyl-CoA synthase beta subunit
MLLQLDITPLFKAYPFKFNSQCLKEEEFAKIAHEVWQNHKFLQEEGVQRCLLWKLKALKNQTKQWVKQNMRQKMIIFEKVEEDIEAAL